MNFEVKLKEINNDYKIISRFKGGMSNYTFLVENSQNEKFVYRFPGEGSEIFVDFIELNKKLIQINELDITNKCIYYNEKTGEKIATYIEGENVSSDVDLKEVAKLLKKIHRSNMILPEYEHLNRLEKYEKTHTKDSDEYDNLKKQWLEIFHNILKENIKYPTHGDAQFANLIQTEYDIKIIDWEFSGKNDYIYDISCFGNTDFENAIKLLNVYEETVTTNHFQRLYGWRIFQCLQWYNVASIKHQIGLSEKLDVPFDKVSDAYLEKATNLLLSYKDKFEN